MKYSRIDQSLFKANRARFIKEMAPNSIAVFHSNDEMPRSADQNFPFRQAPDLFYLTGIDQEKTVLVLFPDAPLERHREILFIRETNDYIKVWEGHKYTMQEAQVTSGIKQVHWIGEFDGIMAMIANHAENIYLALNEHDRSSNPVPDRSMRFVREARERFPLHNFLRSAPIISALRMIKSELEVEMLAEACRITKLGFERVMRFTKPGVYEYEIEAEIMHEFLRNRATGYAYYPIVASGENACILHYCDNNQECKDGDLILMDFGAEYANYNADLTRTIPVNGRYTDRQRDVYEAVLRVMKEAISMLRPGLKIETEYNVEVGKCMEKELIGLGLLDAAAVKKQNPDKPLYKKYFMHGTSHHLGLDVHDVGNRYAEVQKGMVFTVEPGIYIPAEKIGVRIENDVVVTDGAPLDLMAETPREVGEIEEFMNSTAHVS